MYRWMGAQVGQLNGTTGTRFAVWAPNATEVCVICDRNGWRHGRFFLNSSDTGIWSGFMPQIGAGDAYKFSLRTRWGEIIEKADPYAFAAEHPPKTASIICDIDRYTWRDDGWMQRRRGTNWFAEPISIYGRSENEHQVRIRPLATNFFSTMGVPILAGRDFQPTDRRGRPGACSM